MNFNEKEKEILKSWQKNKIFEKSISQRKGKPFFSFYDGPPFATGLPHYGHILTSTIKDVIPRYWAMKGYYVPRRWGWDCHGLPIENIIEAEMEISGKKEIEKIGIKKFNISCRKAVLTYVQEWGKMVKRIGRFVDFENSYKTMDNDYIESVWWAIKEIWKKGLIYEDRKVLLYCSRCESPISNFEVAMDNSYQEKTEETVFVKFKIKNEEKIAQENKKEVFFLAWTTTPWTLPSNMALAVNEKLTYILVEQNKEFYLLAESRKEILGENFKILKKYKGKDLKGIRYKPLYKIKKAEENKNKHQILLADFISSEDGTGIVHIAPVYGEDDYVLGKKFNLPIIPLLDIKGHFNEDAPEFIYQKFFKKADSLIKDDLFQKNIIYKKQEITHPYPFCWRCETALFYNAIPAWFINIQKIKKRLIQLNKNINWYPSHLKKGRFLKGLESAPDWTISRNRYWASPLPIWKCGKCEHQEFIGSKKDLLKQKFTTNRYIFLRHGQNIYQEEKRDIIYPSFENDSVQLSKQGVAQIEKVAKELKKEKIDIIFSSDFLRTKETAKIINKEAGAEIIFDKRLRDLNLGIWHGKTKEEFFENFDLKDLFWKTPKEGENWMDVKKRMYDFLISIDKKHKDKNILIIGHGDPLWLLEGAVNGQSNEELWDFKNGKKNYINVSEVRKISFKKLPYNEDMELDFHRPYIDEVKFCCPKCENLMERISEVVDCWLESASMPFAELHYPFENKEQFQGRFPAHFISEYIPQTRCWFYVMHVVSAILFNKIAFKNVIATGTILNEEGQKMSKSKKNYPDPWEIIDKYGVDSLRFYLMSSSLIKGGDLFFSEKELKEVYQKNILLPLNILAFYQDYQVKDIDFSKTPRGEYILDKWILSRLNYLIKKTTDKMNNYDVVSTTREIKEFISDLSIWYLRRSRDRFKKGDIQGIKTFGYVLFQLSLIIAPFTPFLADYIYQALFKNKNTSVHLEDWPKTDKKIINEELNQKMNKVREIVSLALAERASAGIKVRQPLQQLIIDNKQLMTEKELLELIKEEINVKEVIFGKKLKLNIKITVELKEEGLVREIIREIQGMRKEAGLKPKDKIIVEYLGLDKQIFEKNKDIISKQTNIKKLVLNNKEEKLIIIKKI